MLDPKLLEILACPVCRNSIVPDDEHKWLSCNHCSLRYPVDGDIPIMLAEEAVKFSTDSQGQE